VAARVNGVEITRLDFERAAQAVQNDRRNVVGPEEVARILDSLINEELLAQEAVRIGLVHSDREVRSVAVRAVMRLILSDLDSIQPDEASLRRFYDDNPNLFVSQGNIWLRHLEVASSDADTVEAVRASLADGASYAEIRDLYSAVSSRPAPDRMIRVDDLNQYVGASLTEFALAAEPGTIIGPLSLEGAEHFLWIVDRQLETRPSFEDAIEAIEVEWRKREEDAAVLSYLERLRNRASIDIDASAVQ